MNSSNGSSK